MKISLLGGVGEIGGNKFLLEHKGTKILLDFGMGFAQAGKYYSEFLQPRKCSGLNDFFELGLLPKLKGAYREDYLKQMGLPNEKKEIDALFLTHAHADHAQYIHFLRFDIPIYCSRATKIILQSLEETGSGLLSELITACEAFTFYKNTRGELSRVTRRNADYVHERKYNLMSPDNRVKIGSLEIEMVPVDHSLPGACGFIVYSDEGNLVYTGDIRFHGSNQELSRKFVEKAKSVKPKWLLSEGTRIDVCKKDSEENVKQEIQSLISGCKDIVFVEHPIRDLDRVTSIYLAAKANKREFVVNLKLAYLIEALGDLCPFSLQDVKILISRKSWGLICKENVDCRLIEQDYETWEREFISRKNAITYKELVKNPSKYVVSMNMWEIGQLIDIK